MKLPCVISELTVKIFDVLGKEIAELVNEKKQAGSCLCLRPLAKTGMQSI